MSTPTTIPYDWVRQIPSVVKQLDQIPLLGNLPSFPWDAFAKQLKDAFQLESLTLKPSEIQWRTMNDLYAGLPKDIIHHNFLIPPLNGTLDIVISRKDIETIFRVLLGKESSANVELDEEYFNAFYQFVMLETLHTLQKVDFDKSLTPQIQETKEPITGAALSLDVQVQIPSFSFATRVLISTEIRDAFKAKYAQRTLTVPSQILQRVEVVLHAEVGKTDMKLSEWEKIALGDMLLLESLTLSNDEEKARVMLTLNGTPVFRGRVKGGSIKILEYPLLHEVEAPMAKFNPNEDEESEFEEEELTDTDLEEEDEDHLTEEETLEEDHEEEEEEEDHPLPTLPPKAATPGLKKEETPAPITSKGAPTPKDIPITITIEVGRIQMTVQKLMELQPGNLLELNIHPEEGVDLVINGKCVGKGELLKIGDILGVRIVDLA